MSAPPAAPSSPALPVAQRLPFPVLVNIAKWYLVATWHDDEDTLGESIPEHGGKHCKWNSHEDLLGLFKVCGAWWPALQHVLYSSVRVIGERAADRFLATTAAKPELGNLVRRLVVGLERGHNGEDAVVFNGQGVVSRKLLNVVAACPQVSHIQVRPLHDSVGQEMTLLLATLPLYTLVVGPRLKQARTPWTGPMFNTSTLPISHPSVVELEINAWVDDVLLQTPLPQFPVLPLRHLCIQNIYIPTEVFEAIVSHAPGLEFPEVYSEHVFDVVPAQAALAACTNSLKQVVFLANPDVDELRRFTATGIAPLFDRVLPLCTQLESLFVSASEISINLFTLIPPSVKYLRIQAYNHLATFYYASRLIEHLEDMTIPLHLETFEIHDAAASWEENQVHALHNACLARGIEFHFRPDAPGTDDA